MWNWKLVADSHFTKIHVMRCKLSILLILLAEFSFSQSLNNDQINRLADAGKVWGYLKYFHPFLQYKNISWDSAFSATVPKILASKNKTEYEESLKELFEVLHDPVTDVIHILHPNTEIKKPALIIDDSVMVITRYDCRTITDNDPMRKIFDEAISQLEKVKAIIFDLRPDKETFLLNEVDPTEVFEQSKIISKLFKGVVTLPAVRTVKQTTFNVDETTDGANDYQPLFQIRRLKTLIGKGKRNIPVVFIINKYSQVPIEALALQSAGKAAIIQEEEVGEIGIAPATKFFIADSLLIRVRNGEIINSENGLGFFPNFIIPASEERVIALQKAREILKSGIAPYHPHSKDFSGFTSNYNIKKLNANAYPSVGERVLAAAKMYTIIKYFYPNKYSWTKNWDSLYVNYLPRFVLAADSMDYVKAVIEMYAHTNDAHGFLNFPVIDFIQGGPAGSFPAFRVRLVENQLVITTINNDSLTRLLGIKKGDILLEKDGINCMKDVEEKRKYISASNYETQSGMITNRYLSNVPGKTTSLKLRDAGGKIKNIQLPYFKPSDKDRQAEFLARSNGKPVLYFITKDIGYVNMGALFPPQVDSMFEMFKNTKAIIFDLRQYPNETYSLITSRLNGKKPSMVITDLPGVGYDFFKAETNKPKDWIYQGKAVCLIHENTQSHGETSAQNLKIAGATLIGNHTAGVNGPAYWFYIPGNIRLAFTVSYVPGAGMGIQPDILVRLTIKGIQQGKDEILERAVKYIETGK
jgi:C-terminal processing protease CtpA/Prc